MNQFEILKNRSKSSADVPYLIHLQSDTMELLATRLVAPLRETNKCSDQVISRVHLPIVINGVQYTIFISEMAAIPVNFLGDKIYDASKLRQNIIEAIDLLFTGF